MILLGTSRETGTATNTRVWINHRVQRRWFRHARGNRFLGGANTCPFPAQSFAQIPGENPDYWNKVNGQQEFVHYSWNVRPLLRNVPVIAMQSPVCVHISRIAAVGLQLFGGDALYLLAIS